MDDQLTFDLTPEQVQAIQKLAGNRLVRLTGSIEQGKLVIDNVGFADKDFSQSIFVPVNAPFKTAQLMVS